MQLPNKQSTTKRIAVCGLLVAVAIVLSYVEFLLPIAPTIPGIKLGLANLVILSSLYFIKTREVLLVLTARILLSGILFGNLSSVIYSLAGGMLSFLVMLLVKKINVFSKIGISIAGGVFHNVGQLIVAYIVVKNVSVILYAPLLLATGALSGCFVGIVSTIVMKIFSQY